jgi:hypothetical protein
VDAGNAIVKHHPDNAAVPKGAHADSADCIRDDHSFFLALVPNQSAILYFEVKHLIGLLSIQYGNFVNEAVSVSAKTQAGFDVIIHGFKGKRSIDEYIRLRHACSGAQKIFIELPIRDDIPTILRKTILGNYRIPAPIIPCQSACPKQRKIVAPAHRCTER